MIRWRLLFGGHETSASALAWTLYLLALYPEWQDKCAEEAAEFGENFSDLSKLKSTRDVFREALRLYPPVPMMVREATQPESFRNRSIATGAQIVLSPWHLQRHARIWDDPDEFQPERWSSDGSKDAIRNAYMPFSAGPRVCTGAGFAMIEGVVLLTRLLQSYRFETVAGQEPVPVAHLTVRQNGIWLTISLRSDSVSNWATVGN